MALGPAWLETVEARPVSSPVCTPSLIVAKQCVYVLTAPVPGALYARPGGHAWFGLCFLLSWTAHVTIIAPPPPHTPFRGSICGQGIWLKARPTDLSSPILSRFLLKGAFKTHSICPLCSPGGVACFLPRRVLPGPVCPGPEENERGDLVCASVRGCSAGPGRGSAAAQLGCLRNSVCCERSGQACCPF